MIMAPRSPKSFNITPAPHYINPAGVDRGGSWPDPERARRRSAILQAAVIITHTPDFVVVTVPWECRNAEHFIAWSHDTPVMRIAGSIEPRHPDSLWWTFVWLLPNVSPEAISRVCTGLIERCFIADVTGIVVSKPPQPPSWS